MDHRNLLNSAQQLAAFSASLSTDDLPCAAKKLLLLHVADTLGLVVGCRGFEHVEAVGRYLSGRVGRPQSTVPAFGIRTSVPDAAFANGVLAHAMDFDDAHKFVHPGCVVVPAVLAIAEALCADGRTTLAALAVGYEVAIRVAIAAGPDHRRRGFHPTGTCAIFGATAGCARAMGLSAEETYRALGLAGSMASGIGRYRHDGSANKQLHAGIAARNGVEAAQLAAAGLTGATDVFTGSLGFLEIFAGGGTPEYLTDSLGSTFEFLGTDIKPYPSCRQTHGAIDISLKILAEHDVSAKDIHDVRVDIYSHAAQPVYASNTFPETWLEAALRIPYCTAATFFYRKMDLEVFSDESRLPSELRDLTRKVVVYADPALDRNWPNERPVKLTVRMTDGKVFENATANPLGSVENPLPASFVFEKYSSLLKRVGKGDRAHSSFECIMKMEDNKGVAELIASLD